MLFKNHSHLFLVFIFLLPSQPVSATDIAQTIQGAATARDEQGNFFELGLGVATRALFTGSKRATGTEKEGFITLSGSYFYKGFFAEAVHSSDDGLNLGYQLLQRPAWNLDLLALSFNSYSSVENDLFHLEQLEDEDRDFFHSPKSNYNGAGLRATAYLHNYVFQARLLGDTLNGIGPRASLRAGRSWQRRNLNFHALLSAEYTSAETNRYFYGVTEREATARFPAYRPGASGNYSLQLGLSYPVSEHLVWRAISRIDSLSKAARDSPFYDTDRELSASTSISYVF